MAVMTTGITMIGATGLIGRHLWPLLERRGDLLVLGRRASGARRERLGAAADWPGLLADLSVDVAVSTLGTTRRKAGSFEAFAAVDRDAVIDFAQAARGAGARQFIAVSSVGADPSSRSAYLALKGEVERAVADMGFDRVDIARPGLLLGKRIDDPRTLERFAILASPLLDRLLPTSLSRYRAINAEMVAAALARLVGNPAPGLHVHHNDELARLAAT